MHIIHGRQEIETSKIVFIFAIAAVLAFSYQAAEAGVGGTTHFIDESGGGDCEDIAGASWDQDSLTCSLGADLLVGDNIVIDDNDITLDGNGNSVTGFPDELSCESDGISAVGVSGITIDDVKVTGFFDGIFFGEVDSSTIKNSILNENCGNGMQLFDSHANLVSNNDVESNCSGEVFGCAGIFLHQSSFNDVRNNDANLNGDQMNEIGQGLWILAFETEEGFNFITGNEFDDNGDEGILIEDSVHNFIGARPPIDVREVGDPGELPEFDLACDIMLDFGGIIIGNSMDRNGDNGIVVRSGSNFTCVIDNTADGNADDGIDIRSVDNDVQGNQANNNDDDGFDINEAPNSITDNVANFNDEDGIELMKQVKTTHPDLPYAFLSAGDNEKRAMQAGANGYLSKPYDFKVVEALISKLL